MLEGSDDETPRMNQGARFSRTVRFLRFRQAIHRSIQRNSHAASPV